LFGGIQQSEVHVATPNDVAGYLELERAEVRWFLSIDRNNLPKEALAKEQTTYRSITIDGVEVEFSEGFTELHTEVYKQTLAGKGFGLNDARPSVTLAHDIRVAQPVGINPKSHEILRQK
jgi:UDP-N-acetyl-2-amino-2-deoxyglucuronate dehydrogenase